MVQQLNCLCPRRLIEGIGMADSSVVASFAEAVADRLPALASGIGHSPVSCASLLQQERLSGGLHSPALRAV